MAQPQVVTGFFDNVAEAQQAVQLLLSRGFPCGNVGLSTQTGPNATTGNTGPTDGEKSTGRFLSSLFGESDDARPRRNTTELTRPGHQITHPNGAFVTVQAQSADEAKRATNLLNHAGAGDVSERTG